MQNRKYVKSNSLVGIVMISHSHLLDLLKYDPENGVFTWLVAPRKNTASGSAAGSLKPNGYIRITINGRAYYGHRLAWFYMYGEWPSEQVDHINLIRSDNRSSNLRLATRSQNLANARRPAHNTSGLKGVSWSGIMSKWLAQIQSKGQNINLGYFSNPEDAHQVYLSAARELYGEYARAG